MGRCTHFSSPSLAAFERIHREHSFGWAFENLDVFLTERNSLDRAGLQANASGASWRGESKQRCLDVPHSAYAVQEIDWSVLHYDRLFSGNLWEGEP